MTDWDPNLTYVVGHQRPDTDAIASALGYAWLLDQEGSPFPLGDRGVVAARAGQPNPQTLFALQRFGLAAPQLLGAVAPTFAHTAKAVAPVEPAAPLAGAVVRIAAGERVVPVVAADGRPLGAVTPAALARAWSRPAGLAAPCAETMDPLPPFAAGERLSDHRGALLRSEVDDFLVVDESGGYLGVATRARLLGPPRARLVLVDHNELEQAVPGAEEAEIVAVLDHHRLGNPPTALPIPFVVEPVGSTCTLVAEQCRAAGQEPPADLAGLMLSGILSDTLLFRSPTVTDRDRSAAGWLAARSATDLDAYGAELLRAAPGLGGRAPDEVLDADRKSYTMADQSLSIAQVEVGGFQELADRRQELLAALAELRRREALALACLMVTDVVAGRSRLLAVGERRLVAALPFRRLADGEFDLGDMVSRKKQLVPALHAALEAVA